MTKRFSKVLVVALAIVVALAAVGCSPSAPPASNNNPPEAPKKVEYPTKAVTILHGFNPGGGSDQLALMTKPYLEKALGQQFVNVYKPGADGAIAWKEVAEMTGSKADGYTITTVLTPKTQLNQFINKSAGYKMEDFVGVANVVFDPGVLVVNVDSPFKTMQDVLDHAKANPGKLKMAHSGDGGDDWFNAVMIEKLAGVTFNNIPFQGDGPAWQAAAGNHVDANCNNFSVVSAMVTGNKLRALAVFADKRLEALPDVPTLKELGIDFSGGSYRGYMVPKDTPAEFIAVLADALEQICKDPEFIAATKAANLPIHFLKGAELKTFLENENKQMGQVVKDMGLAE